MDMELSALLTRAREVGLDERTIDLAEQGDATAQCDLGACYANGQGVEIDLVEAVAWYRKAAEQGDADAQGTLGWCYTRGRVVEQDQVEAVNWYRKAAEQGNAWSQYRLGICCRDGLGITQNYEDAYRWFLKASVGLTGEEKKECDTAKSDLQSKYLTQSLVLSLQRELSGSSSQSSKPVRTGISKDAQNFVWKRDGGRCVECGSNENLEFDHIIPVSKGGSNTARNLQLLCEPCNRRKGASI
jgi:5-methylcytosine-specific restriction endonuclease McrA